MSGAVAPIDRQKLLDHAAGGTGRSQATVVEQSRAIAEVQGALLVADRRPRDRQKALAEALESCRTQEVATHAFFKFPRGGQSVSGPSIHLARELARCWGNIVYAVVELDRDDGRAMSEMMAYAWDLETNTRSQTQFLVPHKRDKKGGPEVLTDMRDIYENNANMGARRLRECIFAVLPPYLTKAAEEQCFKTLQGGTDEKPLPARINEAVEAFAGIGIDRKRIEARMGPIAHFTEVDYANLRVTFGSIKRNEVRAEDEFPKVDGLTADALRSASKPQPRQTTAEYLGDSIPALDQANDGTFSAENPTAAEGPADEDRGEANTDDRPAWFDFVEGIKSRIAAAKTKTELVPFDADFLKQSGALPDEVAQEVEGLFAAKRRALAGEDGK